MDHPTSELLARSSVRSAPGVVLSVGRSSMVEICVRVYLAHHPGRDGSCVVCGVPIGACVRRRRAARVLAATRLDLNLVVADASKVHDAASVGR